VKKLIVGFFSLILLVNSNFNVNAEFKYSNEVNGYSVNLPDEWSEIPKEVIDKYLEEVSKALPNVPKINFITGFQLEKNEYFVHPYILVQEHDAQAPSYKEIERLFLGENFKNQTKKAQDSLSEVLNNSTFDKPVVDKEKNRVYININMELKNGQKIKGIAVLFIGKKKMIQFNFYSLEEDFNKYLPVFEKVNNSFEFKDEFKFKESEGISTSKSQQKFSASTYAIFGGISILGVSLLSLIFYKILKKDSANN